LWKKHWAYSKGNRPVVILYLVFSICANIINFLQPLVVAWLLNTIQQEGVTDANIVKLILICSLFIGLMLFFWAFHGPSRVLETKNAFLVRANYKKRMVDGVLALPPSWHSEHHSGDTIDRIEKGSNGIYNFSRSTYEVIETLIRFFSSLIALFYFNLSSGFVVVFFVIIAVTVVLRFDARLRAYWREMNRAENATSQKVFDFISNITTVIILRMERLASSEIMKKIMAPYVTFSKWTKMNETKWALVSFMSAAMIFGVLVAYLLHELSIGGTVLVGTVFALYSYVDRISGLFYRFAYRYSDMVQQKTAVENAEEIAKDFMPVHKAPQVRLDGWKELRVEHLTFSYDGKKANVTAGIDANGMDSKGVLVKDRTEHLRLKDTAVIIRRGEKIALIGESGSGKTTFLKLLRGLYTPEHAEITVDGKRLTGFEQLTDSITLIPQDPELFTTTIRENITMGVDHDDETIQEYTDLACFTLVADRLPNKLESSIKEKGVNLSGGEKQRLALARGLIAGIGKEIILMDEPTSSVDSKNEMAIYKNVFTRFKDATVISTVHRLHMLPMFDTIYLFDKGKLVASGSHAELMQNPRFKALWKKYAKKK